MPRILSALLILLFIGPNPWADTRRPVWNATQQISAARVIIPGGHFGPLEIVEAWALTSPHSGFGGFSAMALTGDRQFLLVSDAGHTARFALDTDGRVSAAQIMPLLWSRTSRKRDRDAEAMWRSPVSGETWLAFEGSNRIMRLDPSLTRTIGDARPWEMRRWSANGGPEAMTRLADGRFLMLAEGANTRTLGTAGILYPGDPTQSGREDHVRFGYRSWGMGKLTDAATVPDGRVLLLHRQINPWRWFTSTLAIGDPARIADNQSWTAAPLAAIGQPQLSDNFEALAITPHPRGISIWLASDDNFNTLQRSLLIHLLLPWDALPPR